MIPKTPAARAKRAAEYIVLALELPAVLDTATFNALLEGNTAQVIKFLKREIRENLEVARAITHQAHLYGNDWVHSAVQALSENQNPMLFPEFGSTFKMPLNA